MKKRILIISGIFPPDIGGPASYVPLMANHLTSRGHEITVFTYSDQPAANTYPFKVYRVLRKTFYLFRELKSFFKILKLVYKNDLIFSQSHEVKVFLANFILRKPRIHKVVGDPMWERAVNKGWFTGTLDDYTHNPQSFSLKVLNLFRNFSFGNCQTIIVPSHYLKKIVSTWGNYKERTQVVYNSFPSQSKNFVAVQRKKQFSIVSIGRMVPWKGFFDLAQVLSELPEEIDLTIIGDGPLKPELSQLIQKLNLSHRIHLAGRLSHSETLDELRKASCFVLNSDYEGLPHVVLEAYACGCPVIATDVGGTGEVIIHEKTGLLIKNKSKQELKEALLRLKNDSGLRKSLSEGGALLLNNKFNEDVMLSSTEVTLGLAKQ